MILRKIVIVVVLCTIGAFCTAGQALPEIRITGLGHSRDGEYFAIVRGIGVVEKGNVIFCSVAGLQQKCLVLDVTKRGISLKRLETLEEPAKKAPKKKYELRDPFWPVGMEP